jgi:putative ABC transport system ATP-binding protein
MAMLSLTGVSKIYHGPRARTVLIDVHLRVDAGEYIAIMGESGVGKSTLLNLIAGLDTPDSGDISFAGRQLGELDDDALTRLRRQSMGFVFQAFHVMPYLSVAENVALPLSLNRVAAHEAAQRTLSILAAVGLEGRASSRPSELSGGELQRVAIARALVHRPKLLLADEPTGNLDADTAGRVLALLREQVKSTGAAAILVTHSPAAAASADRVYELNSRGLRLKETA